MRPCGVWLFYLFVRRGICEWRSSVGHTTSRMGELQFRFFSLFEANWKKPTLPKPNPISNANPKNVLMPEGPLSLLLSIAPVPPRRRRSRARYNCSDSPSRHQPGPKHHTQISGGQITPRIPSHELEESFVRLAGEHPSSDINRSSPLTNPAVVTPPIK